jgi:integrase/recombinase XerD
MSDLQKHLEEYLSLRQALGYKLRPHRSSLRDFVDFATAKKATSISTQLALAWAMKPGSADPKWWASRLRMVHHFARFVRGRDHVSEVPPLKLLPYSHLRAKPYIYSEEEISRLIHAAQALPCKKGIRGLTYSTLFALLWVTGLRISEALALDREDVDFSNRLLKIRNTKFGKSRLVPVHTSTGKALEHYAHSRNHVFPKAQSPAFFLTIFAKRPTCAVAQLTFRQLCLKTGIRKISRGKGPRIHDMRHSFAIKSLIDIHRVNKDIEQRVYALSVYLGHIGPSSTYWYFSAVPELLELALERLERKRDIP